MSMRNWITGMGAVMAVVLLTGTPAFADTPVTWPTVPDAPSWYATAPAPDYATGGEVIRTGNEEDDTTWLERVTYYDPSGSSPTGDPRPADIQVSNFDTTNLSTGVATTSDPNVIVFDLVDPFPQMVAAMGTTMTTGFAVTDPTAATQAPAPTVHFLGHGYVQMTRPTITASCSTGDPAEFTVNTVMLGENLHKYLVSFDVNFGDRTAEQSAVCSGDQAANGVAPPASATTPTPKAAAKAHPDKQKVNQKPSAAKKVEAKAKHIKTQLTEQVKHPDFGVFAGWIVGIVLFLALIWMLFRSKRRRTSIGLEGAPPVDRHFKKHFNHDGTPKSGAVESTTW